MILKRLLTVCILVMFLFVTVIPPAYAYLDPGTGSYVFQILIAAIVGLGFLVKVYWGKIKGFFIRVRSKNGETREEEENA